MPKGLNVQIYKYRKQECSNNGVSHFYDSAILLGDTVKGCCDRDDYPDHPVLLLVKGNLPGLAKVVPLDWPPGKSPMFGGCFVYTCDSRFTAAVEEITGFPFSGAVPLHDRFE